MGINYEALMYRVNCLASDLDALYHQAALKLGLSDSVMFVLYLIYEKGGEGSLNAIRREGSFNKQTLNSAIRKLEQEGILYLEQGEGRSKNVRLTEKGRALADRTVARVFNAERSAFRGWTEEEVDRYLSLMEKYNNDFRRQLETL